MCLPQFHLAVFLGIPLLVWFGVVSLSPFLGNTCCLFLYARLIFFDSLSLWYDLQHWEAKGTQWCSLLGHLNLMLLHCTLSLLCGFSGCDWLLVVGLFFGGFFFPADWLRVLLSSMSCTLLYKCHNKIQTAQETDPHLEKEHPPTITLSIANEPILITV